MNESLLSGFVDSLPRSLDSLDPTSGMVTCKLKESLNLTGSASSHNF